MFTVIEKKDKKYWEREAKQNADVASNRFDESEQYRKALEVLLPFVHPENLAEALEELWNFKHGDGCRTQNEK